MSSLIEYLRDLATLAHGDVSVAEEAADKIERLHAALTAMLFVTEQLCETLDVDTYETYIRVKEGKSGKIIARRSVAEIVQAGHDALGEEKK